MMGWETNMKNNNFSITTHKLAQICNVSQGTVDRALNNRKGISTETKEKILSAARKYGYLDTDKNKFHIIGIVIFDLYNEYFSELVMCLERECQKIGYSLVVMFTDKSFEKEQKCLKQLYCMGADGIILCPVGEGTEYVNYLYSLKIPIATIGNKLDGISYVGIDNFRAMYDACIFLAQTHKKIIYYSPALKASGNNYAQIERKKGFEKAADEKSLDYIIVKDKNELQKLLLDEKDSAVLCSTDYYAIEVLMNYPNTEVMGFDNINIMKLFGRKLNSVDANSVEVTKTALHNVINDIRKDCYVDYKIVKNQ